MTLKKYKVRTTSVYRKDFKRLVKRGMNMNLLKEVVNTLANGEKLPRQYKDHKLSGQWEGYRECHIKPNWLLVYQIKNDNLVLVLTRTGTHSEIFGM